jgi:hypothetical protein
MLVVEVVLTVAILVPLIFAAGILAGVMRGQE